MVVKIFFSEAKININLRNLKGITTGQSGCTGMFTQRHMGSAWVRDSCAPHLCGPVSAHWFLLQGGPKQAAHQTDFQIRQNFHPRRSTCKHDRKTVHHKASTWPWSGMSWTIRNILSASTQQLYLCGSSEAMDEMSMPVCTSITFRQPSTPVLRTWRLSVIKTQLLQKAGLITQTWLLNLLCTSFPWSLSLYSLNSL